MKMRTRRRVRPRRSPVDLKQQARIAMLHWLRHGYRNTIQAAIRKVL